ncbi:MAG: acylneuraminate cytidylyltransferase family protein [Candidatus Dormibacteria bacterium]|jgi:N-acylneuraminate cytidylyltransferase
MSEAASPAPDGNPHRVLCLIPARSGSVRVPDKNVQPLGGRTLLERAIATAISAFGGVVVSTDSADYARLAVSAGARVPELRPPSLAGPETPVDAVIQHALQSWSHPDAEFMVLMQATSPFTTATDLLAVVAALDASATAGCALTVADVPATCASLMAVDPSGFADFVAPALARLRTQEVPRLGVPTGGAYAARIVRLRRGEPLLRSPYSPVWVDPWRALDIDTPEDLERARSLFGGGR